MTITRRTVADEIDRLEDEIAELQTDKAEIFHAWREHLTDTGTAKNEIADEVAMLKMAIRRRRALLKDADAVARKDALLDEILAAIQAKQQKNAPAARATPANGNASGLAHTRESSTPVVQSEINPIKADPPTPGGPGAPRPSPLVALTGAASDDAGEIPPFLRRSPKHATGPP